VADTLRIRRRLAGGAAGAPSALKNAELAYNEQDDTLYYGKGDSSGNATSIIPVGGGMTALTALLNLFTSALKGLVPASGGGTANFLRADGTWAAPPSAGVAGDNFQAYRSTDQTGIAANTWTKIQFNTKAFDQGGHFDNTTNYRWTPAAGQVEILIQTNASGLTASSIHYVAIYKNGSEFKRGFVVASSGGTAGASVDVLDNASGTDYYEAWAFGAAATTWSLTSGAGFTFFWGTTIGVGPAGPTGATGPGVPTGGSTGQFLQKNSSTDYDTSWKTPASYPTFTKYTSGSGTYTSPAGCRRIKVRMVGGGGGGGSYTAGANGTSTVFGSATVTGGGGGTTGAGGAGGGPTGVVPDVSIPGGTGRNGQLSIAAQFAGVGGDGASCPLGTGGSGNYNTAGGPGTGYGAGGAGGAPNANTTTTTGGGGGAGGYGEYWMAAGSYSYSVGAGGNGQAANANFSAGATGQSGAIFIEEYY